MKKEGRKRGILKNYLRRTILNPLTPFPPVTGRDERFPLFHSDVITFDQCWHYLCSSSAGGKDLSNDDTQIRVICSRNIREMLGNLSEKLGAKFPVTTLRYPMAKNCPSQ